jgi:hypothetical protein
VNVPVVQSPQQQQQQQHNLARHERRPGLKRGRNEDDDKEGSGGGPGKTKKIKLSIGISDVFPKMGAIQKKTIDKHIRPGHGNDAYVTPDFMAKKGTNAAIQCEEQQQQLRGGELPPNTNQEGTDGTDVVKYETGGMVKEFVYLCRGINVTRKL